MSQSLQPDGRQSEGGAGHRNLSFIFWAGLTLFFLWFTFSRLVFSPVPWPDGSAFFLPALDIFRWPPEWRMHSQAAFVPTYDFANFNTMPLLPLMLGTFTQWFGMGQVFGAPLAIKVFSLLGLAGCAWALWSWLKRNQGLEYIAILVAFTAFLDPVDRWGTLVVRSETWIGLLWILLMVELEGFASRARSYWKISLLLALAAYIHFEAIILVPATMAGLCYFSNQPFKSNFAVTFKRWFQVGSRTALLLSPWAIYALLNFSLFWEQMQTQFTRLGRGNFWVSSPYLIFHSLFLELGSPVGVQKFFNLGKGIFWLLIVALTVFTLVSLKKRIPRRELVLAGAVAFWTSIYLWFSKPEIWFITLCHLTLFAWAAAALIQINRDRTPAHAPWQKYGILSCLGAYGVLSLLANIGLHNKIHPSYSWSVYGEWVSCIERAVERAGEKERPKVWQPHVPDVLVELSQRRPLWDLTRTLDFEKMRDQALVSARKFDAIILTRFFSLNDTTQSSVPRYEGSEREIDRDRIRHEIDEPFGAWVMEKLPIESSARWQRSVCEIGPFFADIAVRF